jgi:hypothetical protein
MVGVFQHVQRIITNPIRGTFDTPIINNPAESDLPTPTRRLSPLKHPNCIKYLLPRKRINRDSASRPKSNDCNTLDPHYRNLQYQSDCMRQRWVVVVDGCRVSRNNTGSISVRTPAPRHRRQALHFLASSDISGRAYTERSLATFATCAVCMALSRQNAWGPTSISNSTPQVHFGSDSRFLANECHASWREIAHGHVGMAVGMMAVAKSCRTLAADVANVPWNDGICGLGIWSEYVGSV